MEKLVAKRKEHPPVGANEKCSHLLGRYGPIHSAKAQYLIQVQAQAELIQRRLLSFKVINRGVWWR